MDVISFTSSRSAVAEKFVKPSTGSSTLLPTDMLSAPLLIPVFQHLCMLRFETWMWPRMNVSASCCLRRHHFVFLCSYRQQRVPFLFHGIFVFLFRPCSCLRLACSHCRCFAACAANHCPLCLLHCSTVVMMTVDHDSVPVRRDYVLRSFLFLSSCFSMCFAKASS